MKKILFVIVLFAVASIAALCGSAPDEIIVEGAAPATDAPAAPATEVPSVENTLTAAPAPTATPAPALTANLPPELSALPVDGEPQLWDTNSPSWDYVFRSAVSTPGQPARYVVSFIGAYRDATILKMSVDDMLVAAYMIDLAGNYTDISVAFNVGNIPAGGFDDVALNDVLTTRFLDVEKGEILPHITSAVWLGNITAGTKLEFFVKDDASLQVNRGLGLVMYFNTAPADLPGGNKFVNDIEGNPLP